MFHLEFLSGKPEWEIMDSKLILHSFDCLCISCKKKWEDMDKDYKKLGKEAKKIETDTKKVLKKDSVRDKLVEKGKKMKARGC